MILEEITNFLDFFSNKFAKMYFREQTPFKNAGFELEWLFNAFDRARYTSVGLTRRLMELVNM